MTGLQHPRGRFRPCAVKFCSYLVLVILLENIIIAWNVSPQFGSDVPVATNVDYDASHRSLSGSTLVSLTSLPAPPSLTPSAQPSTTEESRVAEGVLEHASNAEQLKRNFYRRRPTPVNAFAYNFRRIPPGLCHDETRLVVLIHSHPKYGDRREAIRKTWGSAVKSGRWPHHDSDIFRRNRTTLTGGGGSTDEGNSSRTTRFLETCCERMEMAFVVALSRDPGINDAVDEEFLAHWDIIQGDFIDDYSNMTLKSLLDLKFVVERCPKAEYLVKSDDDMIINLPRLVDTIDDVAANFTRFIVGPLTIGSRVYRGGKWKLTREEFPFDTFPPYESGSAYVISGDVIGDLLETSQYVPAIFIDDVYVTGILGLIVGIKHVWMPGFAYWVSPPPSACDLVHRRVVTGTKMDPKKLLLVWEELSSKPVCEVRVHVDCGV